VSCQDKITECPPVACQYPEQEAGKCCPVCKAKNCVINGVIFKEDSTFTNPVDRDKYIMLKTYQYFSYYDNNKFSNNIFYKE
jgi:hypothetical protein